MATSRTLPRPTGRPRAGVRPVFEDFRPTSEWQDDEQSNILLLNIHLPGFLTNELKVSTEGKNIIRVRGERLVAGNKWRRFQEDYPVSDDCIMTGIRARLEGGILTITIPRKKNQLIQDTNIAPKVNPTENLTPKSQPRVLDNENSNNAPKVTPAYLPPQVTTKSEPTPNKKDDIDPRVLDNQKIQEEKVPTLDQLHIRKQTPNKRADEQRILDDNQRILNKILQEQPKKGDENVTDDKNVTKDYQKIATAQLNRNKIQDETKTKLFGKSVEDHDHQKSVETPKREDNNDDVVGGGSTIHRDKDAAVFLEKFKDIKKASYKKKEKLSSAAATASLSSVNKIRGLIMDMNEERQLIVNMGVAVLVLVALGIQISYTLRTNQDAS